MGFSPCCVHAGLRASIIGLRFCFSFRADVTTAFTAIVAVQQQHRAGLGHGRTWSNFGVLTTSRTWVCTFAMLIGRLELFSVWSMLTPYFWRK